MSASGSSLSFVSPWVRNERQTTSARLGISGGKASGGNRHIYLDAIRSAEAISNWCDRVYKIPDWYIEDVCNLSPEDALRRAMSVPAPKDEPKPTPKGKRKAVPKKRTG